MATLLIIILTLYILAGLLTANAFGDRDYSLVNVILFIFWPIMWVYTVKKFREYKRSKNGN